MIKVFAAEVCKDSTTEQDATKTKGKIAAIGLRKILDLYAIFANGKWVNDSATQYNLHTRANSNRELPIGLQLVVELRMVVLSAIIPLWNSELSEKVPDQMLSTIVAILKVISNNDNEPPAAAYKGEHVCY
jgi:E3 ubiquitin-protein ligase HUWE1